MNRDFMMAIGGLLLLIFFFVLSICSVSGYKTKYEKKKDDDEQMKYISEYNKRKDNSKR